MILILLGLIAAYCLGMWLWIAVAAHVDMARYKRNEVVYPPDVAETINRYTFRLGLCGILALGFMGVIAAIGGV